MRARRSIGVLVVVVAAGCGGGSSDAEDAGDAADDVAVDVPMPTPPALPVLTPCPEGWVEVPRAGPDDVATCDPWPETGYEECGAVDEAHFPGEPGCVRIGTACSADDDWATGLPGDRPIRYVLAGAPAGGDGTRASPFGTIAEATSGAASGTVVAQSKGTLDEVVLLPSGVTLWRACGAETVVSSSVPSEEAGTRSGRRPVGRSSGSGAGTRWKPTSPQGPTTSRP
jgi:hypothetical protein